MWGPHIVHKLSSNELMPQQEILAQATLALCSHSEIITTSRDPARVAPCWQHRSSYSSFTCDWPPLQSPPVHREHKMSLALLGNGDSFAKRICCTKWGAAISCSCSQKMAMSHSPVAGSQQSLGTQQRCGGSGKVTALHRADNGVLALGHRVRAPVVRLRVPAGAKILVLSSLQSSSAVSLPGQATYPQHFSCQFASAANSANSKFHSHLWKGARIAKIRLANVFRNTTTHVKLEPKIPSVSPQACHKGQAPRRGAGAAREQGSRMGAR